MTRPQAPGVTTHRWTAAGWSQAGDLLAAEEPLQLSLDGRPLSIVMRTPGNDLELALGLLYAEAVLRSLDDVESVHISAEAGERESRIELVPDLIESNQVDVHLKSGAGRRPERSFLSSSACGVCGATTMESLSLNFARVAPGPVLDPAVLPPLVDLLRERQRIFEQTGGLHAAALFNVRGELEMLREDIGRHNAVDKVVGRALLDGRLPASESLLAVSGRAGYEVVQKAVAAGIPLLAAVGAPSSLAVATAEKFGVTLVGFLRKDRFNTYSVPERLRGATPA
jgi:FdhD protein